VSRKSLRIRPVSGTFRRRNAELPINDERHVAGRIVPSTSPKPIR
jgi:hypothetical protein